MPKQQRNLFMISVILLVSLQIIEYYFNPQLLTTTCIQATAQDTKEIKGKIYDCITCHNLKNNYFHERIIGKYSFVIQHKLLDKKAQRQSSQPNKSAFINSIFIQNHCMDYNCSSLHILQDFLMKNSSSKNILNSYNMKKVNQYMLTSDKINMNTHLYKYILQSNNPQIFSSPLIQEKLLMSTVIKTRFASLSSNKSDEIQVSMLFHSIQIGIFMKFAFIIALLLQYSQINEFLSQFDIKNAKWMLITCILSTIFSTNALYLVSISAVSLQQYNSYYSKYRYVMPLLYSTIIYAYQSQMLQIGFLNVFMTANLLKLIVLQLRKYGDISVQRCIIFLILLFLSFYGSLINWEFITLLIPIYALATATIQKKEDSITKKKINYNNVMTFDEQQDVLSIISRQLQNK